MPMNSYKERKQRLIDSLKQHRGEIRLGKSTSNLFRDRVETRGPKLDVRQFNHVLHVDPEAGYVEVEGMTPFSDLVDACLRHGVMPTVVPQLKSITIGGATTGCGIESSSFKYGLVHETVQEIEVLLPEGRVVTCTPDNEHSDLFFGFPNSYGTLGYALKLKVKVVPVKPYVQLSHHRFNNAREYFDQMQQFCDSAVDFVDGTVFAPDEMYITTGKFVDEADSISDYTYENIYYRSIREKQQDFLTVRDYIWRWDTDWFWCSKNLLAQNPLFRRLYGRDRLNSVFYAKVMRWNSKWGITGLINDIVGLHTESVIQDVEIPIDRASEFLDFYFENIRFTPIWTCPTRPYSNSAKFDLYHMNPGTLYINFGFWDVIRTREWHPEGHFNRLVETKVAELGGNKSLYSDAYYTEGEFWKLFDQAAYRALKQKYDPKGLLKDLYAKAVLKQ